MTPQGLANVVKAAHAIGECKFSMPLWFSYPREWQDMIVAALEAFGAAQASPVRNAIYLAAKEGNLQFWRAQAAQEKAYNTWKSEGFIGECPQLMKGTLVDYIADAVMSSLVPSTQEKPLSFCSQCGGKDPDCYICGTVVASTEGKSIVFKICSDLGISSDHDHRTWRQIRGAIERSLKP
jgi:hypothetical protein